MAFAIFFTGDLPRECAFRSRTSAVDQARRLVRLARLLVTFHCFFDYLSQRLSTGYCRRRTLRLEGHFESSSTLQRNERVKLAASFWNNVGAGMVIGGMAGAFFLDRPPGAWTKIGIALAGLVLGWLCYSIASNILTYLHTPPEERR
jgi:hypothetical protein